MGRIVPDPADRIGWHKAVDVDRASAFERYRIELLVLEHDVLAVLALVPFYLVVVIYRLAGLGVDILGVDAIAGRTVERVEAHLLRVGGGGQHRHRTGDERQPQITSPGRPRRHGKSPSGFTTDCRFSRFPDQARATGSGADQFDPGSPAAPTGHYASGLECGIAACVSG